MPDALLPLFARWSNFYVIVGSSAGALTGLQFVVMTLITEVQVESTEREISAFGTPTVIYFCMALLISALMNVPWLSAAAPSICFEVCGSAGLLYGLGVIRHAIKSRYNPDVEDWFWYAAAPLAADSALIVTAIFLRAHPARCLFALAGISLAFLFLGIHNAWDTVTFISLNHVRRKDAEHP